MSILPELAPAGDALSVLASRRLGEDVTILDATMEPHKRFKVDVSDPERLVVYVNHELDVAGVVAAVADACERVTRHRAEQRRAALRLVPVAATPAKVAATSAPARPALRVLAGGRSC